MTTRFLTLTWKIYHLEGVQALIFVPHFPGSLGRAVIFMMFLIFLFLYTSYSANIVALLQSSSNQIRTLSDLLNSKLELGVEDQPYTRYYFMVNWKLFGIYKISDLPNSQNAEIIVNYVISSPNKDNHQTTKSSNLAEKSGDIKLSPFSLLSGFILLCVFIGSILVKKSLFLSIVDR